MNASQAALRFACALAVASGTSVTVAAGNDAVRAEMDGLWPSAKESPGASVLVMHKGKEVLKKGYGLANIEWEIPNTPQTRHRIGSVTKCFTAVAVLQLHESGRLNLNDPANKYLEDYPNAEKFTIRHLLTHTAGVSGKRKEHLDFPPGERVNYSNEGYMMLGEIIQRVSGMSYEQFLNERIFKPLGMSNSGLDRGEVLLKQRASGYLMERDGTVRNAPCTDASGAFSAGGLYSTVEDLRIFDSALYSEALLKQATVREAFSPVKLNDGREGRYGYGWMVRQFRGLSEVGHGGDIQGFNSYLLRFPEQECTVIVLCNVSMHSRGNLPTAGDVAHKIAAVVLKDALQPEQMPKAVTVDSAILDRYAGVYEYSASPEILERTGKTLKIVREGNTLFGIDNTGKTELVPESTTEFSPKGLPVKLSFRRDHEGKPTEVRVTIAGLREISAKRMP